MLTLRELTHGRFYYTVEKQSIINLSSYKSKGYTSVVLSDSEVIFLGEREDAAFHPFLRCILFIDRVV